MSMAGSVPAHALGEADFERHPVWRFRLDGEADDDPDADESHVRPAPEGLALGTFASHLVAARYAFADGSERPGAVQVDVLDRKVLCTPAWLFAGGKALDPMASDVAKRLGRITQQPATRPLAWTLRVTFAGETRPRSGRLAAPGWRQALALGWRLVWLRFQRRR